MQQPVTPTAETDQVLQLVGSALRPGYFVMDLQVPRVIAPRPLAFVPGFSQNPASHGRGIEVVLRSGGRLARQSHWA